ncbi:MAG TPA: carbohydrate-binding protein [Firmicutes bacterium]|nr:carbohydrate-binding protein [Bacillota bacterium]
MVFWFGRRKEKEEKPRQTIRGQDIEIAGDVGGTARGSETNPSRAEEIVTAAAQKRLQKRTEYRGDDGVYVSPTPITAGSEVTVKYDGLLARSGADAVYLHAGFGPNDSWREIHDIPMTMARDNMWTATVPIKVEETSRINFCFRDSANNWDNNNGANWSYEIHNGEIPSFP